jgi:SAM-dependent methyltransferase
MLDLSEVKSRQQKVWAAGDYARIAAPMLIMAEVLCETLELCAGQKVLDVAAGNGNAALAAARRWCEVTAIDYVPALLDQGRQRAAAERLEVTFQEGDAEAIPFSDETFDVVLSTIGAMFAPDQAKAAHELVRVCKRGGKIGITTWPPDSFVGEWFQVTARHVPPPPGLRPPTFWGTEEGLLELLGDQETELQVNRRTFYFRYRTIQHWLDYFRAYFGPTRVAFEQLNPRGQDALAKDLVDVVRRFDQSCDNTMVVPGDYLEVIAVRH